jgi:hypothetical protein
VLTADSQCTNSDWYSYNDFFFSTVGQAHRRPLSVRSICFVNDHAANDPLVGALFFLYILYSTISRFDRLFLLQRMLLFISRPEAIKLDIFIIGGIRKWQA